MRVTGKELIKTVIMMLSDNKEGMSENDIFNNLKYYIETNLMKTDDILETIDKLDYCEYIDNNESLGNNCTLTQKGIILYYEIAIIDYFNTFCKDYFVTYIKSAIKPIFGDYSLIIEIEQDIETALNNLIHKTLQYKDGHYSYPSSGGFGLPWCNDDHGTRWCNVMCNGVKFVFLVMPTLLSVSYGVDYTNLENTKVIECDANIENINNLATRFIEKVLKDKQNV